MKKLFSLLVIAPMLLVNISKAITKKLTAEDLSGNSMKSKVSAPVIVRDALSKYFLPPNQAAGIYYVSPGGANTHICSSLNSKYSLMLQGDGNLVLYKNVNGVSTGLWSTNTDGEQISNALFHTIGQLLVRNGSWNIWQGGIPVGFGVTFTWILQDDGNFVRYDSDGYSSSTGTAGGKKSSHNGQLF